jgi:hypothetical protein
VSGHRRPRQVRYELVGDRLAGALRQLAQVVLDSPACLAIWSPAHDHHPSAHRPQPDRPRRAVRRGRLLNRLTIGWNAVEGIVAVAAGSVSLVGFAWTPASRSPPPSSWPRDWPRSAAGLSCGVSVTS